MVSTIRHTNTDDEVDRCIAYYNEIDVPGFKIRRDRTDESQKIVYALTGNMLKNHQKILPNPVNLHYIHIPEHEYDFISQFNYAGYSKCDIPYDIMLSKTISVSTNGDVYVGCTVPWDKVSDKKLFNITECNGDFLNRVEMYCWGHPVNKKIAELRKKYAEIRWCISNGYLIEGVTEDTQHDLEKMVEFSYMHEAGAKAIHEEIPFLNHEEVDRVCSAQMVTEMLSRGYSLDFIRSYMRLCTIFTEDIVEKCDIGDMINFRETIVREAIKRRDQKSDDHANIVNVAEEQEALSQKTTVSQVSPEKLGSALGMLLGLALLAGKAKKK